MTTSGEQPLLIAIGHRRPHLSPFAWAAPGARIVGDVSVGDHSSLWYGATLRGDAALIRIGQSSNVQDHCVVHADPEMPVHVGDRVTIGHTAVLHGCRIGDGCLIGMGAVVMNGAEIGEGSIIAAGAVIPEDTIVPAGSLVVGVPGKVKRRLTTQETRVARETATSYVALSHAHRNASSISARTHT